MRIDIYITHPSLAAPPYPTFSTTPSTHSGPHQCRVVGNLTITFVGSSDVQHWQSVDWDKFDQRVSSLSMLQEVEVQFEDDRDMQRFLDARILEKLSNLRRKLPEDKINVKSQAVWRLGIEM